MVVAEQLGSQKKPKCDFKGSQTNWLLEYIVSVFPPPNIAKLGEPGPFFFSAGKSLLKILNLIRAHPVVFPVAAIQEFFEAARTYLLDMSDLNQHARPKDHMLMHMQNKIAFQGSPALYGNWLDESVNRLLKQVAQGAHASNHARRVLLEFPPAYAASQARTAAEPKRRRLS